MTDEIIIDGVVLNQGIRQYLVVEEGLIILTDAPPELGPEANGVYIFSKSDGWKRPVNNE